VCAFSEIQSAVILSFITHADRSRGVRFYRRLSVCLSVLPRHFSKTTRITKVDIHNVIFGTFYFCNYYIINIIIVILYYDQIIILFYVHKATTTFIMYETFMYETVGIYGYVDLFYLHRT